MDPRDLAKLLTLLRKHGVTEYQEGDLRLVLAQAAPKPRKRRGRTTQPDAPASDTSLEETYSEEDKLFWSSASLPASQE